MVNLYYEGATGAAKIKRILQTYRSAPPKAFGDVAVTRFQDFGVEVFRDAGMTFWTKSAWRDETAMRAFMTSAAHKNAMPHLQRWCSEASVLHWEQETARLPFWQDAGRRMQRDGRLVAVKRPSETHAAGRIPPMKT